MILLVGQYSTGKTTFIRYLLEQVLDSVSEGLRKIYKQKLYPLEEYYKFHEFHSPALVSRISENVFFKDFPGIRIGPEPTTDRFIAVMHGEEEGVVPGNALVVDAKKQFRALSGYVHFFLCPFGNLVKCESSRRAEC
ncbi:unnamed protein product [Cylicostephanus goldi]|uniref:EH domain-containing protein n=1 Tax=Cylicostephanus goldi TaxID=71465 RepID=A0A3P7NK45_CYLGO|nr:unnamed protein product [Cylicostephanus goldi]